jgi:hypothetical protein
MQPKVKNLSLFWVRSNQEQLDSQDILVTTKFEPSATFYLIPTWPHVVLMEIQFIKGIIFRVRTVEILTFRILTHEVEAGQACSVHRSNTHATTLTRMGSIGFTWVAWQAGERSKYQSHSRMMIIGGNQLQQPYRPCIACIMTHTAYTHNSKFIALFLLVGELFMRTWVVELDKFVHSQSCISATNCAISTPMLWRIPPVVSMPMYKW